MLRLSSVMYSGFHSGISKFLNPSILNHTTEVGLAFVDWYRRSDMCPRSNRFNISGRRWLLLHFLTGTSIQLLPREGIFSELFSFLQSDVRWFFTKPFCYAICKTEFISFLCSIWVSASFLMYSTAEVN